MLPVIIQTKNIALIHQIGELRYQVWCEEKAQLAKVTATRKWVEHYDIDATHFVAIHDDRIVAAARVTFHDNVREVPDGEEYEHMGLDVPGPLASFNRLVVRSEYRGRGLSSLLDRVRLAEAFRNNVSCVLANGVGEQRKRSLLKLGFSFYGVTPKSNDFMKSIAPEFHLMIHNMKERPESLGKDKIFHLPSSQDSLSKTG